MISVKRFVTCNIVAVRAVTCSPAVRDKMFPFTGGGVGGGVIPISDFVRLAGIILVLFSFYRTARL